MGAKKKAVSKRREHVLALRLTEAEYAQLSTFATKKGMQPAVWARVTLLDQSQRRW